MANREKELLQIERQLNDGSWRGGGYTVIEVREPKPRRVSAAPFRDRVVHHALCAVVAPIFERSFIADSYANRTGYGTHRAVARYEHYRDRYRHVLRADIYRYFPAIDHDILKADFRRRIACPPTLALLDTIVDGSNPQEPVNLYFPGDDLFSPLARRRGLPIGNLTSQWFANLYLDGFDHYVKEVLRAPYLRYVDDFALFADDPEVLAKWRQAIARYLEGRRLVLHPAKTFVAATAETATFLGYVLCANGARRLPEDDLRRFRNRLRGLRDRWRAGTVDEAEIKQRVSSWIAHAEHADTWRLRHALFRGGWFDPLREPDGPPVGRVLRGGSWNNKPQNARSAKRNRNGTTNRNNNNGFRLASTLRIAGAGASTDAPGVHGSIHGPS
ncbi:RNA-directed DNA polymerase [Accumulibacter sp.]|uniref:RNA-directed DNA polymerase n=1 Tax=Accumulibacter sp. TaxID=2053492 RepID=UPI002638CB4E|nr:RNA-directed DNA polymerase [Accumulibacter sp.]